MHVAMFTRYLFFHVCLVPLGFELGLFLAGQETCRYLQKTRRSENKYCLKKATAINSLVF